VLAPRNLDDTEFWDFLATDGSGTDPTSGFVRVSTRDELLIAMHKINQIAGQNIDGGVGAAWGSVIKIMDTGDAIDLTANPAYVDANDVPAYPMNIPAASHNLVVPTGVTIRGDRRDINLGPLLVGIITIQP
jgi:hypothetical protein